MERKESFREVGKVKRGAGVFFFGKRFSEVKNGQQAKRILRHKRKQWRKFGKGFSVLGGQ